MKLFFCILAIFWLAGKSFGQPPSNFSRPLGIGDTVANLSFSNIVNYPATSIDANTLLDKLLIIDFWATWCTACVEKLPHLDSLQLEFNGRLQILLADETADPDEKNKLLRFFERRKSASGQRYQLPVNIDSRYLDTLFPHTLIPHYVWIDKHKKIIAITSSGEITASNISKVLEGKPALFRQVKKNPVSNSSKPLFSVGIDGDGSNILYKSTIAGYTEGLPTGCGGYDPTDTIFSRLYYTNATAILLYTLAYPVMLDFPKSRTKLLMKEASQYDDTNVDWDTWKLTHTFTYELIIPFAQRQKQLAIMREDLQRYFGLSVQVKKRYTKCWVIKSSGHPGIMLVNNADKENNLSEAGKGPKFIHNQPLSDLVLYLNNVFPVATLNESGYHGKVNVEFPRGIENFTDIKEGLRQAGFELQEQQRELDILEITDSVTNN